MSDKDDCSDDGRMDSTHSERQDEHPAEEQQQQQDAEDNQSVKDGSAHSEDADVDNLEEDDALVLQDETSLSTAELEEEREPPISALPPRVVFQEESQVEVSASPAFQCLDDLFRAGKLTGAKAAVLKAKYTELHELVKKKRENETCLLQQAKEYAGELERQRTELEKADDFPEGSNTEVSKCRQQLLNYQNELATAEERQYQHEYKIECLREEHTMVEREYARMPKEGEVEKKIEELKATCAEMRKEVGQRQMEAKRLREDLETENRQLHQGTKDLTEKKEQLEDFKAELVAINTQPSQLAKEADKLNRQKYDLSKTVKDVNQELRELTNVLQQIQRKQTQLEDEKFELDGHVDKQAALVTGKERDYNVLMKDYEYAKEREAVLMGDKATLDLNLRHINLEKKSTHDLHTRKAREKEREIRNLKKAELQLKVAEDAVLHTGQILEKAKSQKDSQPKDDGSLVAKRSELQREVEQTKRALSQQNSLTAMEQVKVEQSIAEEERLLYEQSDLRIEVVELTRLAAIKHDEREQKARDFMRAEQRHQKAIQDLKSKRLQIQEHKKKDSEMKVKLRDFAQHYDVIKNERNKCVNLIQTSTQKAAEMREKIKILQNEIEILRTAVYQKERQLQKQRLKHVNAIVIRDSLRNETAKQRRTEEDMREKREQQRLDIDKLNMLINQTEEQMVQLRKKYETSVQHRNDRGIQLIERNEEVCIFYEKVNVQDQMVRNGNVEMQAREEEIRFLKMQLQEEKRAIELLRKNVPNKTSLDREVVTLQIQIAQCQDRLMELESKLEDPNNQQRVHFLEGKDMKPAEMQGKVEELEVRLSEKEEALLEKDLIFEQVCRLVERIRTKAESGKDDTLSLAKNVNDLQAQIKEKTRKMMAMVSELSMQQANCLRLQQTVKEKEADLEQCYIRMEKSEPPSLEMEREWQRMQRADERRRLDLDEAQREAEEEEQYTLPGGVTTTAEPRPNAYIPDDEGELPIPRPYGSNAPFKPSEPGSTMRHIRKPIPKPIEI